MSARLSSRTYDRADPPLSTGTLLCVVGGAASTLGLCWLTGYLDHIGYRLATQVGVLLLLFVPGSLYWRMHPAWRTRLPDASAASRVGAATATAVALGVLTALGINIARHGVPIMSSLQALTLGLFIALFSLVGGWAAASLFRQEAMKRMRPPEATMSLAEFLALPNAERLPRRGAAGIESEWSELRDFHLRGSRIQLIDVARAGNDDDGVFVP